jgi:parvulin-like peptidyl-prolyl isomerase
MIRCRLFESSVTPGAFGLLLAASFAVANGASADEPRIAAVVDDWPISLQQVDREISRALGDRTIEPEVRDKLRRETLRMLIERRLIQQYLTASGSGASRAEVDRAVQRLQKLAAEQALPWPKYLARRGIDELQLRDQLEWEIGWTKFLEKQATDENLRRYFDQHRRDFDGTQIRAAHILLSVESADDAQQVQATIERVQQIRQQIVAGDLSFAAAAAKFSQAPTADDGGKIGLIGRRGPMPEAFSKAAFALDAGQVSPPVLSPFGVHLVQCIEVVPGDKTWQQVRGDLHQAVSRYLYRWAIDRQRGAATIEIHNDYH